MIEKSTPRESTGKIMLSHYEICHSERFKRQNTPVNDCTITMVNGRSDDLIEFTGEFNGGADYGRDDEETLIHMSDGTIMTIRYDKVDLGTWAITLINKGSLFNEIKQCTDQDAESYSDIAYFNHGIKYAYVSTEWKRVK